MKLAPAPQIMPLANQAVPPKKWDLDEVADWLKRCKLDHVDRFREHRIFGRLLVQLDEGDLKEMGIDSNFQRKRVLAEIEILKECEKFV